MPIPINQAYYNVKSLLQRVTDALRLHCSNPKAPLFHEVDRALEQVVEYRECSPEAKPTQHPKTIVIPEERDLASLRILMAFGKWAHEVNKANGWEVFHPSDWAVEEHKTDTATGIREVSDRLQKTRFLATHIALIHSEVSEALEALRTYDRENFAEELADVIIRVTSVAYGLGIDLDTEVAAKIVKNSTRGQRHGGKAV